ncbi:transglutaminase-like cysteine peptidase [Microbulbifer yueqingensis]|nr:transglutaminase-like cysteine peptidase [Microbulbifer yueqingensis]
MSTRYGAGASERLHRWEAVVLGERGSHGAERLGSVNRFLNRMTFVSDREHWQLADYWATPAEFLATGAGDCEDYALAKLFSLYLAGTPLSRLRLMYVEALPQGEPHMVLLYTPEGGEPLVLDNLNGEILPASARTDLRPVYSFNGAGLWLNNQPGGEKPVPRYRGSRLWDNVVARMRREGFDL